VSNLTRFRLVPFSNGETAVFARIKLTKHNKPLILSLNDQYKICDLFNSKLTEFRNQYNSMNLINYRNMDRKRISFEAAYSIIKWAIRQI
jgi:hypothetical protein